MAGLTQQTSSEDAFFGKEAGLNNGKSDSPSAGASPLCPQCGSKKLWRDAFRYSVFGDKIQRWLCRDCGLRFSDPNDVKNSWSTIEKAERAETKAVKAADDIVISRQICVTETKNLVAEHQTTEVLRRNEADTKGSIVEFSFWLLKQGYSKATIRRTSKTIKQTNATWSKLQRRRFNKRNHSKTRMERKQKSKRSRRLLIASFNCTAKHGLLQSTDASENYRSSQQKRK